MVRLGLKGNELLTYALIYGFSQDGTGEFCGGLAYIAEWLNTSKRTALNAVQSLAEKGLIIKHEIEVANNVKVCRYKVALDYTPVKNFPFPSEKFSPNNIKNINTNKSIYKPPTVEEVQAYCVERANGIDAQAFVDYYQRQGWKLANGQRVVDWKACVRTWERREKKPKPTTAKPEKKGFSNYEQRGTDYDAILARLC